jgi:hypothetical protein
VAVVKVALEEGFDDDTVIVEVNGRQVFEGEGVSTRTQIGLATSFEVEVDDESEAVVAVRATSQRATGRMRHPVGDRLHVGVSVQGGDIVFRTSEEPFGYL